MNTKQIIKRIAREKGITPEEVESEMRFAIREAMTSKNPRAQMLWKQIAPDGKEPSIDRFLKLCVEKINERKE